HYLYGSDACARLLRAVVLSMFSFMVFFAVISGFIQPLSVVQTFALATVVCLAVQGGVIYVNRFLKQLK
ncbi:MAG: hypothetical protein ACO1N7_01585, partial [Sphingobacteriaceae bacterium]